MPAATKPKKLAQGWGWPALSNKAHYFVEARALCGRFLYTGPLEEGNDRSPDNCPTCVKKLHPPPKPLNTQQLAVLRASAAHAPGSRRVIGGDRSTAKALAARGLAIEAKDNFFYVTDAGLERARRKADVHVRRDGHADDPSLLLDLCPTCDAPTDGPLCPDCKAQATAETEGMR